ncbi:hypothetical protein [Kutzneria chonburiensis]|uniref:Head-tail adaptor protein n=1 Tax=Kutzneria chonburiensis TaxID=1483604 RepID=A0ABV6N3T4_9PSEU|nr:hypothetical protein [Kutzneria chonburiensis]
MIPAYLLNSTVQILHPTWTSDRYGNRIPDFSAPATVSARGRLYESAVREVEKDRNTEVGTWFLILPASVAIDHNCRVTFTDYTGRRHGYDVEGVQPRNGLGGVHHLTVRLTEVEGWP